MRHSTPKKSKVALLLKEIADVYRFLKKTPKEEKNIVFYSEHDGYSPYLGGLVNELVDKNGQTLCYITSDPNDTILKKPNPKIKTFYLNKLLPLFMSLVNCKVFVMTLTDLNKFHLKRSANPVHYVYMFHSLVSTHMVYREGAFDHYDSFLCFGPHQIKELRKNEELNKIPAKKLIEAGYYRLERINESYKTWLAKNVVEADEVGDSSSQTANKKKTILVAPSWGVENILESCGERLIELLLGAGYEVIVRPHPETIKRSPELIDSFASKFGDNHDFTLELSVATDDSLHRADVLITDYSGITFEYSFGTERPVLFLNVLPKVNNPEFEKLGIEPIELSLRNEMGIVVSPRELEKVLPTISELIENKNDYKKTIQELRDKYVFHFGKSSEIGAKHVLDLLLSKPINS